MGSRGRPPAEDDSNALEPEQSWREQQRRERDYRAEQEQYDDGPRPRRARHARDRGWPERRQPKASPSDV